MTLQQLEYIVAVGRFKHFARAADYCKVTQPTLSSMIQKLEDELGLRIFDRRRLPVEPTRAGAEMIRRAEEVLRGARCLRDAALEEREALTGTFTVGVLPTIAPYLLPRFFPALLRDHPDMDIRIVEMKTAEMRRAIAEQRIDAGILARIDGLDELEFSTLYYEQFYVYVSESDPLAAERAIRTTDLAGSYLWLLDEGHCFRDQLVRFCSLPSASLSRKACSLGSIETFMRMVEGGKGVTFIPELAVLQLSEEQRRLVRPFALPIPVREVVTAVAPDFVRHRLLSFLSELIRASVPRNMLRHSAVERIAL